MIINKDEDKKDLQFNYKGFFVEIYENGTIFYVSEFTPIMKEQKVINCGCGPVNFYNEENVKKRIDELLRGLKK